MNGNQRRRDGALAAAWWLCGVWGKWCVNWRQGTRWITFKTLLPVLIRLVCKKILCNFFLMSICVFIMRSLHLSIFSDWRWTVGCVDLFFHHLTGSLVKLNDIVEVVGWFSDHIFFGWPGNSIAKPGNLFGDNAWWCWWRRHIWACKIKWKRCLGQKSWSPRTFFFCEFEWTKSGSQDVCFVQQMHEGRLHRASHFADRGRQDRHVHTSAAARAATLLRCAGLCGSTTHTCCCTPAWLPRSRHA